MIAAILVSAAVLSVPPGFYEARVLEPAASYVAAKSVRVYCAPTLLDLTEYAGTLGVVGLDHVGGLADIPALRAFLAPEYCDALRGRLARRKVEPTELAWAVEILTHEAVHLRGVRNEGQTDCTAMHTMPGVAVRYFHVRPGKQLRALMANAWVLHRGLPDAYQSVC